MSDETPFEWQNTSSNKEISSSYSSSQQTSNSSFISLVIDFGQNFNKKFFNKKALEVKILYKFVFVLNNHLFFYKFNVE